MKIFAGLVTLVLGAFTLANGGFKQLALAAAPGFKPEPRWELPPKLQEAAGNARLTVVFAPARPGCSSALVPPLQALQRFAKTYPEARMWTALRPELQLPEKYRLGSTIALDTADTVGFGGQEDGVVAAYDRSGRTLLFRVFTRTSADDLFAELETAYSLTVPNGVRWAALDALR